MTQSKTSLILHNLVELAIPTCTDSKYLTFIENKETGFLSIKLSFPFTFLLQKVLLEESNSSSGTSFHVEMITKHAVTHGQMRTIVHETEIIDFKKEKIDWRFKTRMRSNSNEFLESPLAFAQKIQEDRKSKPYVPAAKKTSQPTDSEDLNMLSSDEELDIKEEGKILILGNGISNQFTIYMSRTDSKSEALSQGQLSLDEKSKWGNNSRQIDMFCQTYPYIKLFIWPTFRLPTGSSVIALINTSFLFATKRLEQERQEADFLVSLSLISSRKFIQASEKLRKIQTHLLGNISVKSLLQAMNIELIIGESMNQHSQISEKMFAFHRAVLFYKLAKRVEASDDNSNIDIDQTMSARKKIRLKQDEAYKYLLKLQPHLVQVLLMNIDCHIQAVRMASLKTLEFLFDTLGCNLDESLIPILIAIIKTYPSMTKRSNVPRDGKVISFFEDNWQLSPPDSGRRGSNESHEESSFSRPTGQIPKLGLNRFSPEHVGDLAQHSTFFSLNDIHSLKDCQVKDASLFHQSFIQTSKNFYNHILESMIFLLASTSTSILVRIFDEVIQKIIFQDSIEQDLQIYLLRLSDKILNLCQGYVTVSKPFLNTLFELILTRNSSEAQGTASRGNSDEQKAKVAQDLWQTLKTNYLLNQSSEGIQSFISWVMLQFNNLTEKVSGTSTSGSSNKDSSDYEARSQAQLRDATMSITDQQKLLLLLELTNLLIYGQARHSKNLNGFETEGKSTKRNLHKLAARQVFSGMSFNLDQENIGQAAKKNSSAQMKLISIEMCQLMEPVIFWLNFTIERPDRLNFFKAIWSTLTKLVQIIPSRKQIGIEFDCIQIIMPTLQRVETFCQTSSPSLEMLQFLIVVFTDIKGFLLTQARKRTRSSIFTFLQSFLMTFARNLPHNLHDEVFEVCSLLIDLVGSNGLLNQAHVREILEALVHKYTMRSKAHKHLSDQFLQKWILNQSLIQFGELKKQEYQFVDEQQFQQLRRRNRTSSNQIQSSHPIQFSYNGANNGGNIATFIDGAQQQQQLNNNNTGWNHSAEDQPIYNEHLASNSDEEAVADPNNNFIIGQQPLPQLETALNDQNDDVSQGDDSTTQQEYANLVPQRASSQPSNFLQHANLAAVPNQGVNDGNESTQANENGSNHMLNLEQKLLASLQNRSLFFDTLIEFSLFSNFLSSSDQFISEQDQEQIYFEKLSVLQDVIEALKEEHNSLFKRLLYYPNFHHKIAGIFSNDRARGKIVKLMKSMTAYFLKYNSPKTFYEHPIVQTSALPVPQPQQQQQHRFQGGVAVERTAGTHSQLQFAGHQLHSEPSLDLLNVMNQDENGDHADNHEQTILEQDLNLQRMNPHYSQHVERQQNNFLFNFNQNDHDEESPHLAPSNVNMFFFDEVNLINNERLILIRTYTILIKIQLEQIQVDQGKDGVSRDSQSQLQALTMMDMLLFSLCPVPSFQNVVIRNLLSPDSGTHAANNNNGQMNNDFSYQITQPHRLSFQFTGLNSMLGSQMGISNQDQHNDAIPDFETMIISQKQPVSVGLSETQAPMEPNSFPKEFECWDIRYQHSRLALAFKFWPFVEHVMFNSSWNNIKASCYSVLGKFVQIPDISQMSANYQKRLKELLFPLLNRLLKSQESEGRAAGLNILGSFCGLSSMQSQSYRQSMDMSDNDDSSQESHSRCNAVFDSDQGQDYHYDRYEQRQKQALSRNQIKIKDHLHLFRRNPTFVSLAIWQEVFDLQENWNQPISNAAEVLIQLCAPKDSVKHFKQMSNEKNLLKVSQAQQALKTLYSSRFFNQQQQKTVAYSQKLKMAPGSGQQQQQQQMQYMVQGRSLFNSQSVFNGMHSHEQFSKQSSQQKLMSAHPMQVGQNFSATAAQFNQDFNLLNDGVVPNQADHHVQPDLLRGEEQSSHESSDDEDENASNESQLFYMEELSERQLQQAVRLFSADYKPFSGLWVDRSTSMTSSRPMNNRLSKMNLAGTINGLVSSSGHDDDYYYGDSSATANSQSNLLIDFFEDNMLEEVTSIDSKEEELMEKTAGGKDGSSDRHQTASQSDGEDLGIIDLDKQEGSEYDDFDQLDDEKLPVLKNTYSKKNRPNNSKSVAIGSRSQGDVLRIRSQALQVLKAADEEIKVQIKEHPEMLSGLQLSFASHRSHEKKYNTDLLEERKRCYDDGSLHYPESGNDWLSSLSESADRMHKKRRIQSGKAQSCLSEDRHIIDRQHSKSSKTDSSNASHSTPMEIGDIQIIMHQEIQNHYKHRLRYEREKLIYRDQAYGGDHHDIRSLDTRNKRNRIRKGQSESDVNEQVSFKDSASSAKEEYEVVSAPVKRYSDKVNKKPSSAYKLSTQTIDSLTELSSPLVEEALSTQTPNAMKDEEEQKRKLTKSNKIALAKGDSKGQSLKNKMYQNNQSQRSSGQNCSSQPNHSNSNFLQTMSKGTQQNRAWNKQPVQKLHTTQSKNQVSLKGQVHKTKVVKPALGQTHLKLIQSKNESVNKNTNQPESTPSQKLTTLQKPVLNNAHSQQFMLNSQNNKMPKHKQVLSRNSRNGAAVAQNNIQNPGKRDKRPSSLVIKHAPDSKHAPKRNNFMTDPQSPRDEQSTTKPVEKGGAQSQRSSKSRPGQEKRQSRQAELLKFTAVEQEQQQPQNDDDSDPVVDM